MKLHGAEAESLPQSLRGIPAKAQRLDEDEQDLEHNRLDDRAEGAQHALVILDGVRRRQRGSGDQLEVGDPVVCGSVRKLDTTSICARNTHPHPHSTCPRTIRRDEQRHDSPPRPSTPTPRTAREGSGS